jgi:hypothetical protein
MANSFFFMVDLLCSYAGFGRGRSRSRTRPLRTRDRGFLPGAACRLLSPKAVGRGLRGAARARRVDLSAAAASCALIAAAIFPPVVSAMRSIRRLAHARGLGLRHVSQCPSPGCAAVGRERPAAARPGGQLPVAVARQVLLACPAPLPCVRTCWTWPASAGLRPGRRSPPSLPWPPAAAFAARAAGLRAARHRSHRPPLEPLVAAARAAAEAAAVHAAKTLPPPELPPPGPVPATATATPCV